MVALAGIGSWAYAGGRLPFGPLTDQEQSVADDIGADFESIPWASNDARMCAAEGLVRDQGLGGLRDAGVVSDSDEYQPDGWERAEADDFFSRLVECRDSWPEALAAGSSAPDTLAPCLEDAGADALGRVLAVEQLELDEDEKVTATRADVTECAQLPVKSATKLSEGDKEAVLKVEPPSGLGIGEPADYRLEVGGDDQQASLDDDTLTVELPDNEGPYDVTVVPLYGDDLAGDGTEVTGLDPFGPPKRPSGKASPGYRSVKFSFDKPQGDGGDAVLQIKRGSKPWADSSKTSFSEDTRQGGDRSCVRARTASGSDGAEQYSDPIQVCGTAQPRTVKLVPKGACNQFAECAKYDIRITGFASGSTHQYVLRENGADITDCDEGSCDYAGLTAGDDGRYTLTNAWNIGGHGRTITVLIKGTAISDTVVVPGG